MSGSGEEVVVPLIKDIQTRSSRSPEKRGKYQSLHRALSETELMKKIRKATGSFNRNQGRAKLDGLQNQYGQSLTDKDSDGTETRTAKTAPSTPEAEVKSIIKNESKASLISQQEMSFTSNKTKTPSPEMPSRQRHQSDSPVLPTKTRNNDKFHKVFRNVSEEEELIKQFSCAYVSDILLQGTLYITENLFCFHSKIVGKKKLIEIQVEKVVAITREKTAFIIPNAIGVVTDTDKYVFGSLISRDNAFRLMYSTWRKKLGGDGLPKEDIMDLDGAPEIGSYSSPENNNFLDVQRTDSGTGVDLETTTDSDLGSCASCCPPVTEVDSKPSDLFQPIPVRKHSQKKPTITREPVPPVRVKQEITYFRMLLPYILLCFDYEGNYKAVCQFLNKLRRTARMNLLLAGCSILVLFFVMSATVLAYKVTLLQAHIEGQSSWSSESKYSLRSHVYKNLYSLHNDYQAATIEKLHAILRANINILEDVYLSLRSLQESQRAGMKFCKQKYAENIKEEDITNYPEESNPNS